MDNKKSLVSNIKIMANNLYPTTLTDTQASQSVKLARGGFLGKIIRFFAALIKLSNTRWAVLQTQEAFEAFKFEYQDKFATFANQTQQDVAKFKNDIQQLNDKFATFANQTQQDFAQLDKKTTYTEKLAQNFYGILQTKLKLIEISTSQGLVNEHTTIQAKPNAKTQQTDFDGFYVSFEKAFRGSPEAIKEKLTVYVQYVLEVASKTQNLDFIDLGCGSGEWLELLSQAGLSPIGVDLNALSVHTCNAKSLKAVYGDAIDFLKSKDDLCVCGISAFHLIEHIDFESLFELIKQAYRVLKPGGILIFETPNIANILVSAFDFYRDFSHIKHIHPQTIEFMANFIGFNRAESYFVSQSHKLIPYKNWAFDTLDDYLKAPRDLALIAYKDLQC